MSDPIREASPQPVQVPPALPAPRRRRPVALIVLAALASLYTLYFARDFLIPIAFAVLLDFLLTPLVRGLARLRIPPAFGAAIVVLGLVGVGVFTAYRLAGPVQTWVAQAPATIDKARREVTRVLRPFERVRETAEQVQEAADGAQRQQPVVVLRGPSVIARVFGSTQRFLAKLLEMLILLYFLLAAGDLFMRKLIKVLPHLQDKLRAVRIGRQVQSSIATYLATMSALAVTEGLLVAGALQLLGMPNPLLFGAMVAALEFIPYLGALVALVVFTIAGLGTFPGLGQALLVPGVFLLINLIMANVVAPLIMGQRLALNPVAVFVGFVFWFWIWGVPGAFIAVPLLAGFKIFCDHIDSLRPVGEFLGRREETALP